MAGAGPPEAAPAPPPPATTSQGYPTGTSEPFSRIIEKEPVLGSIVVLLIMAVVSLYLHGWLRQNKFNADLGKLKDAYDADLKAREAVWNTQRAECIAQVSALQEARLSLLREVMNALGNATAAMTLNSQSTAERTASAQQLTSRIGELVTATAQQRDDWQRLSASLQRQVSANGRMIQHVYAKAGGTGVLLDFGEA